MKSNALGNSLKFVAKEVFFDILFFPVWWYSIGTRNMMRWARWKLRNAASSLALRIWLKNIFKPMYGDYSIEGRLISFFMRLIVTFAKSVVFLFWAISVAIASMLYLIAPVVAVWYILFEFAGVAFPSF